MKTIALEEMANRNEEARVAKADEVKERTSQLEEKVSVSLSQRPSEQTRVEIADQCFNVH